MNEEKVSVIIPFYNRTDETIRAVQSVFKQSYNNYEIILVNDGSSVDIKKIKDLVNNNKKINLVCYRNNMGVSHARNEGIKKATGKYIAFLDSDDEFMECKIEKQLDEMKRTKAVFSHTSYVKKMENNKTVVMSGEEKGFCARKMMYNCLIATPTVMIDREWLMKQGVMFNEEMTMGEDTCFWLEIMKREVALCGIMEPLSVVNVGQSAAAYDAKKQLIGMKEILRYLINDDYYRRFDYEIARAAENYIYNVRLMNDENGIKKKVVQCIKKILK